MRNRKFLIIAICFFAAIYAGCHKKPMFTHFDFIPLWGFARINSPICDYHGNFLYADGDLNMVLLVRTDIVDIEDSKFDVNYMPIAISSRQSLLFKGTASELTINAKDNYLVIINTTTGFKKEILLPFNFYKSHMFNLTKKHHDENYDRDKANLFKDLIEILPENAAEINEAYLGGKSSLDR